MIAIVVASKNFRDEEYFIPLEIFSEFGMEVITFSDKVGCIIGNNGGEGIAQKILEELNPSEFSAIIFVGGPGCLKYLDNTESYKIIKEAVKCNCLIGAICIAPVILAKAGVLNGVRATVWSSGMERSGINILKEQGALYEDASVVKDKGIITANGPDVAKEFAQAVVSSVKTK